MKGGYAIVRRVKYKDGTASFTLIGDPYVSLESAELIVKNLDRWSLGAPDPASSIEEIGYHIVLGIT